MNMHNQDQDEYDKEFYLLLLEIEHKLDSLDKYARLKVESWCRKLCQITNNREWKKNRNLHAIWLLDMIINNTFEAPYNKFAPEGSIPIISKSIVKSKLSNKFNQIRQLAANHISGENINDEQSEEVNNLDNNYQNYENNSRENYHANNSKSSNNFDSNNQVINTNKSNHMKNKSSINNCHNQIYYSDSKIKNKKEIHKEIYENEFDKMKELINSLRDEINFKDDIIRKQDEEKRKMEIRISELERILKGLVMSKEK